jgi:hypothetical protein
MRKKNVNDTLSMKDIIDNDPIINKLDKEIGDINDRAGKRMKETLDPGTLEILSEYGLDDTFTKEQINDRKKNRIENFKLSIIEKINTYVKEGYINEDTKKYYINCYIEFKQDDYGDEDATKTFNKVAVDNKIDSDTDEESWNKLLSELDNMLENNKREHELSIEYGNNIAHRIIKNEVWLNMTEIQLNESRGYPDDTEQELTPNGEIEVFIYGNKQIGSYFTLQDGKVIKIKDRQKKEY